MVDPLRVQRLLRALTDELAFLEREASAAQQRQDDAVWVRGVKYGFITAIETCVDIAQHICSSEGWGPPADNGDTMEILRKHGALDPALATAMRKAVGFRNVLVHDYLDVDDGIVHARLNDLSDLRTFARQIAGYLTSA